MKLNKFELSVLLGSFMAVNDKESVLEFLGNEHEGLIERIENNLNTNEYENAGLIVEQLIIKIANALKENE